VRLHHGEGSWYRPKQAMEMEPSGAGWPGDRIAAEGGAQKVPRSGAGDGGTVGLTGLGVQTGLFEDQSESPTAPSGRL